MKQLRLYVAASFLLTLCGSGAVAQSWFDKLVPVLKLDDSIDHITGDPGPMRTPLAANPLGNTQVYDSQDDLCFDALTPQQNDGCAILEKPISGPPEAPNNTSPESSFLSSTPSLTFNHVLFRVNNIDLTVGDFDTNAPKPKSAAE